MTDALLLLAFTAFVCGYVMRDPLREHFTDLAKKLAQDINTLIEMLVDIAGQVYILMLTVYAIVMMAIFATIEFSTEFWQKVVRPYLLAIRRFLWKWWWVPVAAAVAYIFIWGLIFTMEGIIITPDYLSFFVFLATVVLVFLLVIMTKMPMLVFFLLGVFVLLAGLMILGIVGANLYGLMLLFGLLIGLFLGLLASIASVIVKWVAAAPLVLAVLLTSLIPSCGDNVAIKIPQMGPEAPSEIKKETEEHVPPYTVTARAVAQDGDGCISMLDRLGIAEADAKLLLDTDRLSWCVNKAHEAGRVVYWHSDPKRWMAPKVCMKKVPGRVTQHEEWMLVTLPDGRSSIVMPPDSPMCTPRP